MYRLTLKLIALFSLIPPMLAATIPVGREAKELENRGSPIFGKATWYTPGLGSCGWTNNGDQLVLALSQSIMDKKVDCGRTVQITYNGKKAEGTVVDTCPGCDENHIDLSAGLFKKLASIEKGVIQVEWYFV